MEWTRRWTRAGWLLAVPVLTGVAGVAGPPAADLLPAVVAPLVATVLWRAGTRIDPALRGWRLLAVAVVLGAFGAAVADLLEPGDAPAGTTLRLLAPGPGMLLVLVAVVTLIPRGTLRNGGVRLLTSAALFGSASLAIAQLLVVGPVVDHVDLPTPIRTALEVSCGGTALVLSAVLLLTLTAPPARWATSALLLVAAVVQGCAEGLVLVGGTALLSIALHLTALVLLCLAARRDPGPRTVAPATPSATRLDLAGQLLPHLGMAVAALLFAVTHALGATATPAAGVAALSCAALVVVHRAFVARDEARAAARLRRNEAHLRSVVSSSSDAALIVDDELRIRWAAPALEAPAGPAPLTGRPLADVVHPEDAGDVTRWLADGPTGLRSFRVPGAPGSWRVLEAGASDLREDADVRGLVLHCHDVTERVDRERELRALAFSDTLTGLPNGTAQRSALRELLVAERPDVTLLHLELHGVGAAREAVGRAGTDAALAEVARRLRATVRADDHVARTGPDQFSVLASGTGDEPDRLADRLLSVIEAPIATGTAFLDLTAVVGLVPLTADLTDAQVLDRAELAVADARAAGEGSVRRYRADLGAARDRRDQLRGDLAGALDRRELTVLWQPVVALEDHRVTGVEALLRWRHPVLGDVTPDEVLAVAERAGLAVELQRWVLREAVAASAVLSAHAPEINIAVNAAPAHLAAGTLVDDVAAALAAGGLPADRLVVELPEEAFELASAVDDVAALRLMGVRLALDDLGGSRSTLSRAGGLPVDIIKLDRSLLARVDRDRHARAVCEALVGLGAALRVDVVAEGVETAGQLAVLRAMGCGFAQGFLLSRPVPLPVLVDLLCAGEGTLWPGAVGGTPAARGAVLDGAQAR